ncbi:hypothetical protein MnTg03_01587 [bacterium MnTg03]|nr:hypothetical protein MnTg03_01587 [bacterium MnTg03]
MGWCGTFNAEGIHKFTFRAKFLYPVIVEISDKNITAWADRYTRNGGEPTIKWAKYIHRKRTTPLVQQHTIRAKCQHTVVIAIGNVECTLIIDRYIGGIIELATKHPRHTGNSPLTYKGPISEQMLHSLVKKIGHKQFAFGIHSHAPRCAQFTTDVTRFTDTAPKLTIESIDLNPVIEKFSHV